MRRAFSLVEMSIVLVVIGLLVGGIMAGQSLIESAKLKQMASDYAEINAAVMAFREQYNGNPGDILNATSYFGSAGGDGANTTCLDAQTMMRPSTCNGNQNGSVDDSSRAHAERFLAWKHLASGGLMEQSFSGVTGSGGTNDPVEDVNVPSCAIGKCYWDIMTFPTNSTNFPAQGLKYPLVLRPLSITSKTGILNGIDAWKLDRKVDDGLPATGAVFSTTKTNNGGDCVSSNDIDATYIVNTSSSTCEIFMKLN